MAKIFKRSDRITVQIGDVTVKLGPLTSDQKAEIQQYMIESRVRKDLRLATRGTKLALQHAIKDIQGVEDMDGKPYKLSFEGESLSNECVDDLLNFDMSEKLSLVCIELLRNIPKGFTDENGNKLEGVELVENKKEDEPKNV